MGRAYRKLKAYAGMDLSRAVVELYQYRDRGEYACMEFNGKMLFSDTVTMDSAYLEVTGKSKAGYDQYQIEQHEKYVREEAEHKAKIPELTKEWIAKGHDILDKKYWDFWDEIVPIRLGDLYHGMELGMSLDIINRLNEGCSFEEAKEILDNQGHSGMSYGLMCSMLKELCDRGADFVEFVRG